MSVSLKDVELFLPELILGSTVVVLIIGDLIVQSHVNKRLYLAALAVIGTLSATWAVWGQLDTPPVSAFVGQIAIDPLSSFFKLLFAAVTVVTIFTSLISKELPDQYIGEYYALLVSITFGMCLMASANDLMIAYLGLEMVSIVSYALAGYRLRDRRSSEAALKYVVYGGAASGMMLFGISLFYGLFGTTELTAIHQGLILWSGQYFADSVASGTAAFPLTLLCSFVLLFAGIGYKIAVVPFHMWAPDVYEGAPTPFTGFLSVGPKAAGFVLFMRLFVGAFVSPDDNGFAADANGFMTMAVDLPLPAMLGFIAAVTMTLGNLAAIPQNNVKRLLAYSSIAHAGYILMGFVVLSRDSLEAVMFYLVVYYVMNIGAFTVCQVVRDRTGGELLHDFRGFGSKEPVIAVFMTLFLLSLTGLPPLAGFVAKFYLFASVIQKGGFWYVILAVIGVINSAVSLFYYMKVVRAMWLTEPLSEDEGDKPWPSSRSYALITGVLAVPTLVLGLYWSPIRSAVDRSLAFYRSPLIAQMATTETPEIPDTAAEDD